MPYGLPDTPFDTLKVALHEDANIPHIVVAMKFLGVALEMQCHRISVERGQCKRDFAVSDVVQAVKWFGVVNGEQGYVRMSESAEVQRPMWPVNLALAGFHDGGMNGQLVD